MLVLYSKSYFKYHISENRFWERSREKGNKALDISLDPLSYLVGRQGERTLWVELDCGLSGPLNFTQLELIFQSWGNNFLSLGSIFIFERVVLEDFQDLFLFWHFMILHAGGGRSLYNNMYLWTFGMQGYSCTCPCTFPVGSPPYRGYPEMAEIVSGVAREQLMKLNRNPYKFSRRLFDNFKAVDFTLFFCIWDN